MSMIFSRTTKCAVCQSDVSIRVIGSTNAFGPCDLDMRPPEMQRSTMHFWINVCHHCGYISSNIATLPEGATKETVEELLSTYKYRYTDDIDFSSELARNFYQYHMILMKFGRQDDAFYALRNAAWACDDEADKKNAVRCRLLALNLIDKMIADNADNENLELVKIDFLRRSGRFAEVIERYSDKKYSKELLNKIVKFQIEKSEQEDDSCYTVGDVG